MFHVEHRDPFYLEWVERFARPPLPGEQKLFDIAKYFFDRGRKYENRALDPEGIEPDGEAQYTPEP